MYTFAQPISRALSTSAGSEGVVCQDHRRTYAELGSRCRRLAGAMRGLGLARQDRVGVAALNSDLYLELYLGLPAAGYVLVPVNSRLAPAEMRGVLHLPGRPGQGHDPQAGAARTALGRSAGSDLRRLDRCKAR